uniref:Coiled-coil-helix-coiled-coil-helix domain-containing protein 1 n=1 Tax=Magallana gigas TaxID=29159 RepID=A0A8W8K5J4_MAGGI|nr:coiled-coil-helix-coiled-coil-helix domain-containing protein 1 [Crassostrea gigas]XP_034313789.1 coiled-coil-helix-coiled-coil-helix domain-containing protein 1 [Crassostrea gigas]|eukprot:XP_011431553.1 PREDICTED: coiled-coil-helix-coiled-coil-helix domain-containing protein 1-like [Crassostrea gigas]
MPTLTHILFRRPSSFQKRGQLPRAPKARIAGVPVLRNKIGVKNITDFEGHCNEAMQNMLSCLKKAAFDDKACVAEILSYNSCMERAIERERVKKTTKFDIDQNKTEGDRIRYPPPVINKVMARSPVAKFKSFKDVK